MKKVVKILLPIILVVALATSINWGYLTHYFNVLGRVALSTESKELEEELDNFSVANIFNFTKMKDSVDDTIDEIEDKLQTTAPETVDYSEYFKDSFASQDEYLNWLQTKLYASKTLSNEEKIAISKIHFYKLTKEQRKDLNIIGEVRCIVEKDYTDWSYNPESPTSPKWPNVSWPAFPGLDSTKPIAAITKNNPVPQTLDRYGSLGNGKNFSPVPTNRKKYNYNERAICYINNPEAYNVYTYFDNENYMELIDAIADSENKPVEDTIKKVRSIYKKIGVTDQLKVENIDAAYIKKLKNDYNDFQSQAQEFRKKGYKTKYGLMGYAAPWYDQNGKLIYSGGAEQVNLVIKGMVLYQLGIIKK